MDSQQYQLHWPELDYFVTCCYLVQDLVFAKVRDVSICIRGSDTNVAANMCHVHFHCMMMIIYTVKIDG